MFSTKLLVIILVLNNTYLTYVTGNYLMKDEYETQPLRKKVAFGPVCHLMLNQELKDELKGHWYSPNVTDKKCMSALAWEYHFCSARHHRLVQKLKELPYSVRIRYKRNIYDYITTYGNTMVELVSEAASVFIKGVSSNPIVATTIEAAKILLEQLTHRSQNEYNNRSLIPMDQVRKSLAQVSKYAGQRGQYLQAAIDAMDYQTNFLDYLYEELTAAEALIISINDMMKQGKMDVQALGELTEDHMLMSLNPDDTYITKVFEEVIPDSEGSGIVILEFQLKVVTKLSLFNRIKWDSLIILLCTITAMSILIAILLYLRKSNYTKGRIGASQTHRNEETYGFTAAPSLPPPNQILLEAASVRNSISSFNNITA